MAESNAVEIEFVGESSVTSQIAESKNSYEKKFNELQSEIGQLKDLMIAMIEESNSTSANLTGQGSSKHPSGGSDREGHSYYTNWIKTRT